MELPVFKVSIEIEKSREKIDTEEYYSELLAAKNRGTSKSFMKLVDFSKDGYLINSLRMIINVEYPSERKTKGIQIEPKRLVYSLLKRDGMLLFAASRLLPPPFNDSFHVDIAGIAEHFGLLRFMHGIIFGDLCRLMPQTDAFKDTNDIMAILGESAFDADIKLLKTLMVAESTEFYKPTLMTMEEVELLQSLVETD